MITDKNTDTESIWTFIKHQLLDLEGELKKRVQDIEESPARIETKFMRERIKKIEASRSFLTELEYKENQFKNGGEKE